MSTRPDFKSIKDFEEFKRHYWYRKELVDICKTLNIDSSGSKAELLNTIEEYYKGNLNKKRFHTLRHSVSTSCELTLKTTVIECGFCFNERFREFFRVQTENKNFKFTADMVASVKKAKQDNDTTFTLQDLLDIYYGKKEYAKFDSSSCQWNKFLKDFCADKDNERFTNKLKVASIIWKEVRDSTREKIYTSDLITEFEDKIKKYRTI